MGIQLIGLSHAKQKLQRSLSATLASLLAMSGTNNVPKGHVVVYVGETYQRKRFVIPIISYLNHPLFQGLLNLAEEEFGREVTSIKTSSAQGIVRYFVE
ncbi:hypothetical protein Bca101_007523 [Brassica carinata]